QLCTVQDQDRIRGDAQRARVLDLQRPRVNGGVAGEGSVRRSEDQGSGQFLRQAEGAGDRAAGPQPAGTGKGRRRTDGELAAAVHANGRVGVQGQVSRDRVEAGDVPQGSRVVTIQ